MADSNRMPHFYFSLYIKKWLPVMLLLTVVVPGISQKEYFQQFSIEQGLGQSQVTGFSQDVNDNLWIATLGGISTFDGKTFKNYSETEGLVENYTTCIFADSRNTIWIGTRNGVSSFRNERFTNYQFPRGGGNNIVLKIAENKAGKIFVQTYLHLYSIQDGKSYPELISGDSAEMPMSLFTDRSGMLWVVLENKGIYALEKNGWVKKAGLSPSVIGKEMIIQMINPLASDEVWLLTSKKLYYLEKGEIKIADQLPPLPGNNYMSLRVDNRGVWWLNTETGIYQYANGKWKPYTSREGYTNIPTLCTFQDKEENLWFGTNGGGIFRYLPQPYLAYDQFSAMNALCMSIAQGRDGKIYFGTDGSGIYSYENGIFHQFLIPSSGKTDQQVVSLCLGKGNDVLVNNLSNQIWRLHENRFEQLPVKGITSCINSLYMDSAGTLWISGCNGLYRCEKDSAIKQEPGFIARIFPLPGKKLVTFYKGLGWINEGGKMNFFRDTLIDRSHILKVIGKGHQYFLGTSNNGLLLYDTMNKTIRQYTTRNGINSNYIYSMVEDKAGQLWLGTGHGLNRILYDPISDSLTIFNESRPGDISSSEANQDAVMCDTQNNLWFGMASGMMKYSPASGKHAGYMPPLVLQDKLTANLSLPPNENRIAFHFNCASFANRDRITYQYQLEGADTSFSKPSFIQEVIYPGLPAGKYVFKARAVNLETNAHSNTVLFPFEIRPLFYQTVLFKIFLYAALIAAGFGFLRIRSKQKEKRFRQIQLIKEQEQIRLRQVAAEDFHDELGNTITRIQLLSDVVRSKLRNGITEVEPLIDRIKENVSQLYQGTRDVVWALNPQSDQLEEIIVRLTHTGLELFQDSDIHFSFENKIDKGYDITLRNHEGRNILLMFKEAMNNSFKHSKASWVSMTLEKDGQQLIFSLKDNGIGFNYYEVKKGHGSQNMKKRAERIEGDFRILACSGKGTTCRLVVLLPCPKQK